MEREVLVADRPPRSLERGPEGRESAQGLARGGVFACTPSARVLRPSHGSVRSPEWTRPRPPHCVPSQQAMSGASRPGRQNRGGREAEVSARDPDSLAHRIPAWGLGTAGPPPGPGRPLSGHRALARLEKSSPETPFRVSWVLDHHRGAAASCGGLGRLVGSSPTVEPPAVVRPWGAVVTLPLSP